MPIIKEEEEDRRAPVDKKPTKGFLWLFLLGWSLCRVVGCCWRWSGAFVDIFHLNRLLLLFCLLHHSSFFIVSFIPFSFRSLIGTLE